MEHALISRKLSLAGYEISVNSALSALSLASDWLSGGRPISDDPNL